MPRDPQAELEALQNYVATDPRIKAIKDRDWQLNGPEGLPTMPKINPQAFDAWVQNGPLRDPSLIEDRRNESDDPTEEILRQMRTRMSHVP